MPLPGDRGPAPAGAGHRLPASESLEAGGTHPRRHRSAAGVLLHQPRSRGAAQEPDRRTVSNPEEKEMSETLKPESDVREVVREKYGAIAAGEVIGCCSAGCGCNGGDVDQVLNTIGY